MREFSETNKALVTVQTWQFYSRSIGGTRDQNLSGQLISSVTSAQGWWICTGGPDTGGRLKVKERVGGGATITPNYQPDRVLAARVGINKVDITCSHGTSSVKPQRLLQAYRHLRDRSEDDQKKATW